MKIIWLTIMVVLSNSLMSCATPEFYSFPPGMTNYAIISDNAQWENVFIGSSVPPRMARIISIDRETIAYRRKLITPQMAMNMKDVQGVHFDNSIPLSPGEHKLLIEVCEGGGWGTKCARTVIRLHAEEDGRYRLVGSVSKSKDHADIWIEDLKTGGFAVDKIRVKGLRAPMR
jgi:hypothetical protein